MQSGFAANGPQMTHPAPCFPACTPGFTWALTAQDDNDEAIEYNLTADERCEAMQVSNLQL